MSGATGDAGWNRATITLTGALFVYMTAEMFPVGIVPQLADGLDCSRAAAGTLLAVYAIVAGVAILPVVALARHVDRRRLIVASLLVLAVSQVAFAFAENLWWAYAARAVAAIPHGLLWAVVPTVAASLDPNAPGRATARVFVGGALGLVVGAPSVTAATGVIGWRPTAMAVGVSAAVLAVAVRATLPSGGARPRVGSVGPHDRRTRRLPSIPARVFGISAATVAVVTACYIPYTYLSVLADDTGIRSTSLSALQIGYGAAGLVSVSLVGRFLDDRLRTVLAAVLSGMTIALTMIVMGGTAAFALAVILWGAAFACAAPALQSAVLRASHLDPRADPLAASAVYVLAFQLGIAGGSWAGGGILATAGVEWLAPTGLIAVAVAAAAVIVTVRPPTTATGAV
ncbi:MFS transporter [Williamsia sp. M5A3_1d]